MKAQNAIEIEQLSKLYRTHKRGDEFYALRDLSLEIKRGTALGVIGHNGAGKSTLLKILSRITLPSAGAVYLRGKLNALLEVGTGFHPELSGRENIFLNGSILGMKRQEIKSRLEAIVDFSGVEDFLDMPVKHYSSGMYVRLAFAVAAHLDSEILLVDEVLSVGDASFQQKCLGVMQDRIEDQERTVIFVSHQLQAVEQLCSSVLWLDQGQQKALGPSAEIIRNYRESQNRQMQQKPLEERSDRRGAGEVRLSELQFSNQAAATLAPLQLNCRYTSDLRELRDLKLRLNVLNAKGEFLAVLSNEDEQGIITIAPPKGTIQIHIESLPLLEGSYTLSFSLWANGQLQDRMEFAAALEVSSGAAQLYAPLQNKKRQGSFISAQWILGD